MPRRDALRAVRPVDLHPALADPVDYRKSGLSLNHIVGCPLDCGYCVRHLFGNFDMKRPHLLMSDEAAVERLVSHWAFQPGRTPIQVFNRATDPFLPGVKEHLFRTLELLDARGLSNHVLVITRWRVDAEDVERLNGFKAIRVTLLVTWSGIDDRRLEPVDSAIAERSLKTAHSGAKRLRVILYWRPLIAGINDDDASVARAHLLSAYAHATAFTGLFYRSEIKAHLEATGLAETYPDIARRKILPKTIEERVVAAFAGTPLFRKTSCAVSYVHRLPDFNGHYGIREICSICPSDQQERCRRAHFRPDEALVRQLAVQAGLQPTGIYVDERRVEVEGSREQQRYFLQHALNYQVHDRAHPHLPYRHGRADIGW
jgi:DNA repair photolyase